MRLILKFLLIVPIIITFSGCAALFNDDEIVDFTSEPSRAKVYINGVYLGTTPLQLPLYADKSYAVEFRKDGYDSKTYMLKGSVGAGWIILDLFGGLFPIIIDAASNSWYELSSDHVNMVLEKETVSQDNKVPAGKTKPAK